MGNLEDHLKESSERYRREQEDVINKANQFFIQELTELVEEIGNRSYYVYLGSRIKWFGKGEYTSLVREWSYNGSAYTFKGQTTQSQEKINFGIYFPEWNISIGQIFYYDIQDFAIFSKTLAYVTSENVKRSPPLSGFIEYDIYHPKVHENYTANYERYKKIKDKHRSMLPRLY